MKSLCVGLASLALACGAHHARVDYQGHRGARGLAPENTLDAFTRALDLGVDTLEMDVMLTADDVLVVHHDERLNKDITRDASGAWLPDTGPPLRSIKFDELRAYDVGRIREGTAYAARFPDQHGRDGVRIPKLEEVIDLAESRSHTIRYNIEIKTTPSKPDDTAPPAQVADRLVAIVRAKGIAKRTTIQSFDWRGLHRVRDIAPELPRSCLTEATTLTPAWNDGVPYAGSIPKLVHQFGCPIWSPDASTLTRAEVDEAHALGIQVLPWTVNTADDMRKLLGWGVDGIISDFPDRFPPR